MNNEQSVIFKKV